MKTPLANQRTSAVALHRFGITGISPKRQPPSRRSGALARREGGRAGALQNLAEVRTGSVKEDSFRLQTHHGAGRRFSQRTFHCPLSGKPGAFRFGDESHPAAIMAVA
jgi:hypothetical protein